MFKKLFKKINESIKDSQGKTSHTKISSYIILGSILLSTVIFGGIEITNAIVMWKKGAIYSIPAAHITVFGMILGHHLFLLGIKKASENRKQKYNVQGEVAKIQNTTNIPPAPTANMGDDMGMDDMDMDFESEGN